MSKIIEKSYVGIDISKAKLDVSFGRNSPLASFPNTSEGCKSLLAKLKQISNPHVIMEATGGYEQLPHKLLAKSNISVSIVNAGRVRYFAKSKGILEKTDMIDAKVIRWFGEENTPENSELKDESTQRLSELSKRRDQLVEHRKLELQHAEKSDNKRISSSIKKMLQHIEKQIAEIEAELDAILQEDNFVNKAKLIRSFKGCGQNAIYVLLSDLPELGNIDHKSISKLAGLAPLAHESGNFKGKRSIAGGRERVRRALYLCSLSAVQHNPQIRNMYQRLIAKGKSSKTVLIACAHKILHILNAMLKSGSRWEPPIMV